MAQSAMNWDVAPEGGNSGLPDNNVHTPSTVMPVRRPRLTRRVGTVRSFSPPRTLGLVIDEDSATYAIFSIDDVEPCDRNRIALGQTVSYLAVLEADGLAAKHIRIDTTSVPPPPSDALISKGWR